MENLSRFFCLFADCSFFLPFLHSMHTILSISAFIQTLIRYRILLFLSRILFLVWQFLIFSVNTHAHTPAENESAIKLMYKFVPVRARALSLSPPVAITALLCFSVTKTIWPDCLVFRSSSQLTNVYIIQMKSTFISFQSIYWPFSFFRIPLSVPPISSCSPFSVLFGRQFQSKLFSLTHSLTLFIANEIISLISSIGKWITT